eukprot:scaffold977_cov253-Pinguiococcus_pyrenoidosus.AAC.13
MQPSKSQLGRLRGLRQTLQGDPPAKQSQNEEDRSREIRHRLGGHGALGSSVTRLTRTAALRALRSAARARKGATGIIIVGARARPPLQGVCRRRGAEVSSWCTGFAAVRTAAAALAAACILARTLRRARVKRCAQRRERAQLLAGTCPCGDQFAAAPAAIGQCLLERPLLQPKHARLREQEPSEQLCYARFRGIVAGAPSPRRSLGVLRG